VLGSEMSLQEVESCGLDVVLGGFDGEWISEVLWGGHSSSPESDISLGLIGQAHSVGGMSKQLRYLWFLLLFRRVKEPPDNISGSII
jgi:hypothetical protein